MPTNYNFTNKLDYLSLKFPNISNSAQRLYLLGTQTGMLHAGGVPQPNAKCTISIQNLSSSELSPGKENQALRITPTGTAEVWNSLGIYLGITPRPDNLDYVGNATRTYRISFSYRSNSTGIGRTFSGNISDNPYGGSGSSGFGNNASTTITDTNWYKKDIWFTRTFTGDRWVGFGGFTNSSTTNVWTPSEWIDIADFTFTWDEQPTTTTSFDDQFIPADTFRQGNLFGWGTTSNIGILADGSTYRSSPILVNSFSSWKNLTASGDITATVYQSYAIDSSGYLWFWGNSNVPANWPLTTTTGIRQIYTTPERATNSGTWKIVGMFENAGGAAIKTDGTLWTWGSSASGRLGINSSTNTQTLVQEFTSSTNWLSLSCGYSHVAAIKADGTLWTWGRNSYGQLGVNDTIDRSTPVQEFTSSNNWKMVSCGSNATSAIKTNKTMFLWGSWYTITPSMPSGASSGLPADGAKSIPYQENTLSTNWKTVSSTSAFVSQQGYNVALKEDGTAWRWGFRPLSNSSISSEQTIVQFATENNYKWKKCFAGNPTYLISDDTTLWGLGDNSEGQLGVNDTIYRNTPVQITNLSNFKEVKKYNSHTHALRYIDPII